jgi:hypothetical protein
MDFSLSVRFLQHYKEVGASDFLQGISSTRQWKRKNCRFKSASLLPKKSTKRDKDKTSKLEPKDTQKKQKIGYCFSQLEKMMTFRDFPV